MCHGAGRLYSFLYIWRQPLFSGGKGDWLIFSISINLRSYTLAKSFTVKATVHVPPICLNTIGVFMGQVTKEVPNLMQIHSKAAQTVTFTLCQNKLSLAH